MSGFYEEANGIYRLKVPFEKIYTSVFLITTPNGAVLVDCATTAEDVDIFIVPSLRALGYAPTDIKMLVLTHRHGDHAGGLSRILSLAPNIEVVSDVRQLAEGLYTYPLAGHTEDAIGVIDISSHTLISGDGLQGAGVDKYRCNVKNKEAYFKTLERIKNDERVENILFSHAYEPFDKDSVFGRGEVEACLSQCKKYVKEETK